ncbi:MAG: IS3 family transposase [Alcanivoracaceae bacterium]|nr:IS3 family transposase [Alcanivoracaceae bacterium]
MSDRKTFIKKTHDIVSMRRQCILLSINRSTLYYGSKGRETGDTDVMNLLRELWQEHPFLGYRKLTVMLRFNYGFQINAKKVLRLMQKSGIQAIYPKRNTSLPNKSHKTYEYLLRDININRANQAWMVDITYLKLGSRFVYLTALIDVYSRYIVGWQLSFILDTESCLDALEMALKTSTPEIINSDQGCQFTSEAWVLRLGELQIRISMDGKGRFVDNIYIERFWRSIKYEAIYLDEFDDYRALCDGVKKYIAFYNEERPHQSLDYKRPADIYRQKVTATQEPDRVPV